MKKEQKEKIAELKKKRKETQTELDELRGDTPVSKTVYAFCFLLTLIIAFGILAAMVRLNVGGVAENVFAPLVADVPGLRGILPPEMRRQTAAEIAAEQLAMEQAVAEEQAAEESLAAAEQASEEASLAAEESRIAAESMAAEEEARAEESLAAEESRAAAESEAAVESEAESRAAAESEAAAASEAESRAAAESEAAASLQDYVDTYSEMAPKEAAKIFDSMMPDQGRLVAMILGELLPKQRSDILSNMSTDHAVWLTEQINPSPNVQKSAEEIAADRESQRAALREQQRQEEEAALQDYVDTYSAMKPQDAANVFDSMMPDQSDLIARILQKLTVRQRADILSQMRVENAAALTILMEK